MAKMSMRITRFHGGSIWLQAIQTALPSQVGFLCEHMSSRAHDLNICYVVHSSNQSMPLLQAVCVVLTGDRISFCRSFAGEALERERFGADVVASYHSGVGFAKAKANVESLNRHALCLLSCTSH